MIRLIASDLDGTLLQNGAQVLSPEIFKLIPALKKKGIHFIAASGRRNTPISAGSLLRFRTRFPILPRMVPSVSTRERWSPPGRSTEALPMKLF